MGRTQRNEADQIRRTVPLATLTGILVLSAALLFAGCDTGDPPDPPDDEENFPLIEVPEGFEVEKVVGGLNFPTSITWDDEGRMYVAEAGAGLTPERLAPIRIVQVLEDGQTMEVAELTNQVGLALVGMTWHDGAFYVTHRADDRSGAVSRVTLDGNVTQILSGIMASQAEHQVNDITVGPDGRLYIGSGQAGNSAVMGPDVAGPLMLNPNAHAVPCQDIVLRGRNFLGPDFRTEEEGDSVLTGAFVPFGESTQPGQVIEGSNKCGGAILAFNPDNAEGTVEPFASGFRQPIGLAFNEAGELFVGENGADIRGLRPINEQVDATLRVQEGAWHGWPDFSSAREPFTDATFEAPDSLQAPVFQGTEERLGRTLDFVIDHEASGLTPPSQNAVIGRHPVNSSPSLLDVAPASWGDMAGDIFVAEWGDLAPATNPLRETPSGFRVARVDPENPGQAEAFVQNGQPGPASRQGAQGQGIERPFDVQFGPDGAMYIVDYGVVDVIPGQMPPYDQQAGTGIVWKVTPTDTGAGTDG